MSDGGIDRLTAGHTNNKQCVVSGTATNQQQEKGEKEGVDGRGQGGQLTGRLVISNKRGENDRERRGGGREHVLGHETSPNPSGTAV